MRILKLVSAGLLVLVAVIVGIGALLPAGVHVERRIDIRAEPDAVFPHINNLRSFIEWSPWARLDPDTTYRFEGPVAGKGARMLWHSDDPRVGSGMQEIIASVPNQRVAVALSFGDRGDAVAYYDLQLIAGATQVTWGFDTEFGWDIVGRYLGLMFDQWVGADYERGLVRLKALVEGGPASPPSAANNSG